MLLSISDSRLRLMVRYQLKYCRNFRDIGYKVYFMYGYLYNGGELQGLMYIMEVV